jgi:cation diffusion facilitator CzcD-associated flavoprotein CzcO
MTVRCDVAILGAGPYGLSVAAHLLSMNIEARVFGEPMEFWTRQMPMGMLLRSEKHASNISAPDRNLGLEDYLAGAGINDSTQVRVEDFIEYGCWFQKQAVPDLDTRRVVKVDRHKSDDVGDFVRAVKGCVFRPKSTTRVDTRSSPAIHRDNSN